MNRTLSSLPHTTVMSKRPAAPAHKAKSSQSAAAIASNDHTLDVFNLLSQASKKHRSTFNPAEIRSKKRKVERILKNNNALADLKSDQRLRNNAAVAEEKEVHPWDIWEEHSQKAVAPSWLAPPLEHHGTSSDVSMMIMDATAKEMSMKHVPPQMAERYPLPEHQHYRTNAKPTRPVGMKQEELDDSKEWQARQKIYEKGPKEDHVSATVVQLSCIMDNGCLALVNVHGFKPFFYVPFKKPDARRILAEEFPDDMAQRDGECEDYMLTLQHVPREDRPRVRRERNDQLQQSTGHAREYCDLFKSALEQHLQREHTKKFKWSTGDFTHAMVISVTPCVMQDVYGYDFMEQLPLMKIELASEAVKRTVGEVLASPTGIKLDNGNVYTFGLEAVKGKLKIKDWKRYNFTLSCDMSFMIENQLSGMSWITLPGRKYELVTTPLAEEQFIAALEAQSPERRAGFLRHTQVEELQDMEKKRKTWYRGSFDVHMRDLISHHDSAERARKASAGANYVAPKDDWNRLPVIRILSLDIECASPQGIFPKAETDPIISISLAKKPLGANGEMERVVMIWDIPLTEAHLGKQDPNDLPEVLPGGARTWRFPNEREMMKHFFDVVRASQCPVQLTFNGHMFDYAYIFDRSKILGIKTARLLSPFRESMRTIATTFVSRGAGQNERTDVVCPGLLIYDLLRWAKQELKLNSNSLNAVAKYVTGAAKYDLHYSHITSYFYGTLESRTKLCDYNDMDSVLPLKILEHPKRMIIESNTEIARVCGVTISMLMCKGQGVKTESQMHRLMHQHQYGFVCPDRRRPAGAIEKYVGEHDLDDIDFDQVLQEEAEMGNQFDGATCVNPHIGFYRTCVGTLDFASLYPSLIIGYNLSFDSWIRNEQDLARLRRKDPDSILAIEVELKDRRSKQKTGEVKYLYFVKKYRREGILCNLVSFLLTTRNEVKRLMAQLVSEGKDTSLAHARSTALKLAANCFPADHEILTDQGFMNLVQVRRHFDKRPTLGIACHVNGSLEYHNITMDKVITHDGIHDMVSFRNDKLGVSLSTTDNHNMYVRLGSTWSNKIWPCKPGQNQQDAAPDFRKYTARAVYDAGQQDGSTVAQFSGVFHSGVASSMTRPELPFISLLQLHTPDQFIAFLELYGYWLGDGSLDSNCQALTFQPLKVADSRYLRDLFGRIRLPQLTQQERRPGAYGVYTAPEPDRVVDRTHYEAWCKPHRHVLYAPSWWTYFASEYGCQLAGQWQPLDAFSSRMRGGIMIYEGNCKPCMCANAKKHDSGEWKSVLQSVTEVNKLNGASKPTTDAENINSAKWCWSWVWQLDKNESRALLRGLRMADGDMASGDRSGGAIYSSSRRFVEEIVRITIHAGYSSTVVPGDYQGTNARGVRIVARHQGYVVNYTDYTREAQPKISVRDDMALHEHTGTVWCVNVPTESHLIMVRSRTTREGGLEIPSRPVIISNSAYGFPSAFKLYLPDISEAVCNMGRQNLEWTIHQTQTFFTPANKLNPYGKQASVIYGDTDSIMVDWRVNDLYESNVLANMAETMCNARIAYEMSKLGLVGGWAGLEHDNSVPWMELIGPQDFCPVNLVFEKCYWPYNLMRKKNYLGLKFDPLPKCRAFLSCMAPPKWTNKATGDYPLRCDEHKVEGDRQCIIEPPEGSIDSKGIESKRRDKVLFIKDSINSAANKMMALVPWMEVLQSVRDHNEQLASDQLDLSQVIQSASVKLSYGTKCRQSVIIDQLKEDDPNFQVKAGMRVAWVVAKATGKNLRVSDRIVEASRAMRLGTIPDYRVIAETMIENAQSRLLRNYIEHPNPNAADWEKQKFKLKMLAWTQEPFKVTYSTYDRPTKGPLDRFAEVVHTCRYPGCRVRLSKDKQVEFKEQEPVQPTCSLKSDGNCDSDSEEEDGFGDSDDEMQPDQDDEEKERAEDIEDIVGDATDAVVRMVLDQSRPGIKTLCDKHAGYYETLHRGLETRVTSLQAASDGIWKACNECAARVGCDAAECRNLDCSQLFERDKTDRLLMSNKRLLSACEQVAW